MVPLVSILIPAYNAEGWIAEAIGSAQAQTWPGVEIIVVDDGSRDRTLAVARRFESARVKVVAQENAGASAARNRALQLAQGDLIQWLDADDLLAPDKIERQLQHGPLEGSTRTLFSSSWGVFRFRLRKARFAPSALWEDLSPVEWILRKMEQNLWMCIESWLVSRTLTDLAGPWDTTLSLDDDGEYFCRVLCASERVVFVPASKSYVRRATAASLSGGSHFSRRKQESQLNAMTLQICYLRKLVNDDRARGACIAMLQRGVGIFYPESPDLAEKANALSLSLGRPLTSPVTRVHWRMARRILGNHFAGKAKEMAAGLKESVILGWDRTLHRLEKRS